MLSKQNGIDKKGPLLGRLLHHEYIYPIAEKTKKVRKVLLCKELVKIQEKALLTKQTQKLVNFFMEL